jgi:ribose transport system substrate-binding protein
MNVPYARVRLVAALGACAVLTLIVAACGGSSGGSGTTEEASALFPKAVKKNEEFEKRPTSIGLTEPIGKPVPSGKTIDFIQCEVPACAEQGDIYEEAFKPLGWKLVRINVGGTPEEIQAGYQKAIADKPDGVLGSGNPPVLYEKQVLELEKMGIPVVQSYIQAEPGNGITAVIAGNETSEVQGSMMAYYILAHLQSKDAEIGIVNVNGFETVTKQAEVAEEVIEEECPECKSVRLDVPISSIGSDFPQRMSSFLTSHPNMEWSTAAYSDLVTGLPTALKGAGVEGKNLVTININTSIAPYLAKGEYLEATMGTSFPEVYWRAVDTLARIFTDESIEADNEGSTLPFWTITAETLPSETEDFPIVVDYQEQYEKLWGVK